VLMLLISSLLQLDLVVLNEEDEDGPAIGSSIVALLFLFHCRMKQRSRIPRHKETCGVLIGVLIQRQYYYHSCPSDPCNIVAISIDIKRCIRSDILQEECIIAAGYQQQISKHCN